MPFSKRIKSIPFFNYRRISRSIIHAPELTPEDVMLVSYPRSGNTWVRNIIAHILYDDLWNISLIDLNRLVPDIYKGIPKYFHYSTPRVIKSHQPFSFRHERTNCSLYQKNIYVIRHPYDVLRSFYHYQLHVWSDKWDIYHSIAQFAHIWVNGSFRFGSWQEHVLSWYAMKDEIEVLFIKYEDLQQELESTILKIATFLGKSLNNAKVSEIIEKSSRAAMKTAEKLGTPVNRDFQFIRQQGNRLDPSSDLTPDLKQLIANHSRIAMDLFGYNDDHP